jgi:hypothetical protein
MSPPEEVHRNAKARHLLLRRTHFPVNNHTIVLLLNPPHLEREFNQSQAIQALSCLPRSQQLQEMFLHPKL